MNKIKRFVTGLNDEGKATVIYDDYAENIMEIGGWPGAYVSELWVTNETPVNNDGREDRAARPIRHDPTSGGSIFRVVEIPPEKDVHVEIDASAAFESMGSHNKPSDEDAAKHASMHFTNSVDYLVVISGEMHMLMEEGEVLIKQGDCIVQKGTKHAWVNRGDVPCVLAAVLIDAKPLSD